MRSMQCPYCQSPLRPDAAECGACRMTFPRTSALLGAMPRFSQGVADNTRSMSPGEIGKLRKRVGEIQSRFPQLVLQIVMHVFPEEYPFAMYAFWVFNAGNFAGDSHRGKENYALMIVIDPERCEAAITPGYGLEPFLKTATLDHLLELAGPAWQEKRWADGLMRLLEDLEPLLESIAIPDDPYAARMGEF